MVRSTLCGGAAAVVLVGAFAAGCASSGPPAAGAGSALRQYSSPSTTAVATGAFTPTPGAEPTPGLPAPPTDCAAQLARAAPDATQPMSRVCLHAGAKLRLDLPRYPSGWAPVRIGSGDAAKVTSQQAAADGSATVIVSALRPGVVTAVTQTRDDLAATLVWIVEVTIVPADATATITGVVRGYGGPETLVSGSPRMALDGDPVPQQTVTATRSGTVWATTVTDALGRYALHVPPGSYTLAGGCSNPVTVTATAGTTKTDLFCSVP